MAAVWSALLSLCLLTLAVTGDRAPATQGLDAFLATHRADVGSSVALGDGRVLWLFGDTLRPDGGLDHNTAAVQHPDGRVHRLPGTFAPHRTPGHWYWPGQASRTGDRLRILAMDFSCADPCRGVADLRQHHTDVLTYRLPGLTPLGRTALPRRPSGALWSQLHTTGDGTTYVYGSYPVPGRIGKAVEVARVPARRLADPAAWAYLGTRLGTGLRLGTVLSVVRLHDGYRLYSKRLDLWSDEVISYDAPTPYGPWSAPRTVATTPRHPGTYTYAVEAHPEQPAPPGHLVLTYATNCEAPCGHYRVTAITVPAPGVARGG
ncbi:hypothetical protein [Streptomyces sp. NPDC057877]|uniref:hypothetical protein n=1 Tax=Streptomyces sp. NPDC057877 TaxID=3346269 RepID=UPI0036A9720B